MNTTVTQGSIGMSAAIYKLTELGYKVAIPLVDNQEYDLIVDIEGDLFKVEVKSTSVKTNTGNWSVQIKKVRPNRSSNTITGFDNTLVDFLFVYTTAGDCFLIPAEEIDTNSQLSVPGKFSVYKV
jgi:hypothetical protein